MAETPDPDAKPDPSTPGEGPDPSPSVSDLKAIANRLRERIEEEKRRHDLPLDSTLGNPDWDERAKDGHLDRPDDDDED
ncbi:hypothetical protein DFR50_14737 [Roseiarcus fermentans]|uniref:Uncharacterized protein n=1 Tax=Roseiarcus fermentans TaxID=1473586 RepID=A0A366EL60_9HYPH|nr:hypothetical protein [Roseiarcus fermentans]RBP03064.1 hypothetical protein DFR50_14737 [Roseiarcus fermentans]